MIHYWHNKIVVIRSRTEINTVIRDHEKKRRNKALPNVLRVVRKFSKVFGTLSTSSISLNKQMEH